MSGKKTYTISCPKCSTAQEVELYESVNIDQTPELKESLLQNRINLVDCKDCGFNFRIDKPLLYHDPDNQAMIYFVPLSDSDFEAGKNLFRDFMGEMSTLMPEAVKLPKVHLVFSWSELIERVFLLEAGLDERLIEYIKYMIYTQNPQKLNPAANAVLFNAQDSTDEYFCFVIQDVATRKLEGMLQYSREAYDTICETFDQDEQTPMILEMFPGPYVSARALLIQEAEEEDTEKN